MSDRATSRLPAWAPLGAALAIGLGLHAWLLLGLDLHDLPGPGGVLVVRDLLRSEVSQGPVSWFARLPMLLTGDAALSVRLLISAGFLAALLGAALAASALAGRRAAPWAVLTTACWSLAAGQGWLLDAGGLAWGLAWLGVGLAWWACRQRRLVLGLVGGCVLGVGVAIKASALPVVALLAVGPFLVHASWRARSQLAVVLALGLAAALPVGWLLQGDLPWMAPQALAAQPEGGGVLAFLALPSRGYLQGSVGLVCGLAGAGALLRMRRRPVGLVVLVLSLACLAAVGDARAARLQPRHLLPASLGLVVLVASLSCVRVRRVALWPLVLGLVLLGALDTLAYAQAWAAQRAKHAGTRSAALPAAPAALNARYAELPWTVFYESSLIGAAALVTFPADAGDAVLGLPFQERREAHLEVATLQAGLVYAPLTSQLCCFRDEPLEPCAQRVVDGQARVESVLILPGKRATVAPEARPFYDALRAAAGRRPGRPTRWLSWRGADLGGSLPCRAPRPPARPSSMRE